MCKNTCALNMNFNATQMLTMQSTMLMSVYHRSSNYKCTGSGWHILKLIWSLAATMNMQTIFTLCLKNDTGVAHYNFNAQQPILVIFGRRVADSVCYQMVICYHTSANVSVLPGETWTLEIASFQSCCIPYLENDTASTLIISVSAVQFHPRLERTAQCSRVLRQQRTQSAMRRTLAENAAGIQQRCRATLHCSARTCDRSASWLATLQGTLFRPRRRRKSTACSGNFWSSSRHVVFKTRYTPWLKRHNFRGSCFPM